MSAHTLALADIAFDLEERVRRHSEPGSED